MRNKILMNVILPISILIVICIGSVYMSNNDRKNSHPQKFTGCWIEKYESTTIGHCRHNGILTDSGYLFKDTMYNGVVHTTLLQITINK